MNCDLQSDARVQNGFLDAQKKHLDQCHELKLADKLTEDDCHCLKMLWGQWLHSKPDNFLTQSKSSIFDFIFDEFYGTFKYNFNNFNCFLIESFFIIKRFDLLKYFGRCEHDAKKYIEGCIRSKWIECYTFIDQCDGSETGKECLKANLVNLLRTESSTKQECFMNSMRTLLDKSILIDVQRQLNDIPPYPMNSTPCGICLIISNNSFDHPDFPIRVEKDTDQIKLCNLFRKFGFILEIEKDKSSCGVKEIIERLTTKDYSNYDCLVCCLLSYGDKDVVYGTDGRPVKIVEHIVSQFSGKLNGKPKLFFIHAQNKILNGKRMQSCNNLFQSSNSKCKSISSLSPERSDEFTCLSTDNRFLEDDCNASLFIHTLVRTLELCGANENILDVMTRVINKIDIEVISSTLRRQFIFNEVSIESSGQVHSPAIKSKKIRKKNVCLIC